MVDRINKKVTENKIEIIWNSTLEEILGDDSGVTAIKIKSTQNSSNKVIDVHGVFIAIGHAPNTQIFQDKIKMNNGYIITKPVLVVIQLPQVFLVFLQLVMYKIRYTGRL